MANQARLEKLLNAVTDYVGKEKTRIEEEVNFLKAIQGGRTGGAALQSRLAADATKLAEASLAEYLEG